ncbi:MAG: phage portal protein [Patescibacteria group bacterium]
MDDFVKQTYNKISLAQLYVGTQAGFPFGMFDIKPLMNQPNIWGPQPLTVVTRPQEFANYLEWFKKTPEVMSLVACLVTDILSDGWYFENKLKAKRERAEAFMLSNNAQAQLEGWLYDFLILGNGFLFKGKMTKARTKELKDLFLKSRGFQKKSFVPELLSGSDEEGSAERRLQYIPASTMNITPSDRFASQLIYTQRVGAFISKFDEDEVIHIKDLNINGELWGIPRFKAIIAEVTLLGILKDYYGHELDNYGVPPGMFAFPDEQPNSPNVQAAIAMLEAGKKPENKNRVPVISGNLEYTQFDRLKDMEFKNLADFLIRIIAMAWQVPPSRWGGSGGQRGEETVLSNQAYERNIAHIRAKIESVLNSQLFIPEFGVEMHFHTSHMEDEVRVAQSEKIRTDIAEQRLRLGLWNKDSAGRFLNIQPEEMNDKIDPGDPQMTMETQQSQYNQVDADNSTLKSSASERVNRLKNTRNKTAASTVRATDKNDHTKRQT